LKRNSSTNELIFKTTSSIMKKLILLLAIFNYSFFCAAQKMVSLPFEKNEKVVYKNSEKQYYSPIWAKQVVTNVSKPELMVYEPSEDKKTGSAVIIAPGGGLYGLSINSEGVDVANWLVSKGVTAFVLKYRLVPTGEDGIAEITELGANNPELLFKNVREVLPHSIQDGLNAVEYVRTNAKQYGVQPDKIGFMGFSAGGAVTMGVAYNCEAKNKPDFLVPVYPWTTALPVQAPKADASPMLIICATDDPLGLAAGSIELYNAWHQKKINVALQMFSKGGHGFGMVENGLPSDKWIERFYDWAIAEGFILKK